MSTAAALTDSFHIRLYRVEPVTGDRRHPGGGRPERLAVGRNLGIFRPAPRLGACSIAQGHMAPFFMLAATASFSLPPEFSRVIRHFSRRDRAEDPDFKRKRSHNGLTCLDLLGGVFGGHSRASRE